MRNGPSPFPYSLPAAALLLALCLAGCAGSGGRAGSPDPEAVAVGAKDPLYVGLPEISDTVLADLAARGWGDGRFQSELRQEILFQFNRKGVPTVEDSAAAAATLAVRIDAYGSGEGASGFRGGARLRKAETRREYAFRKTKSKAAAPSRQDPTVDNIRAIAESVVSGAWKSPRRKASEGTPMQMWMLF